LDLNNDREPDIALLVESLEGPQLIVLMQTEKGYDAYVLSRRQGMYLSCHFGKFIKETSAGAGKKEGRTYETPGTYVQLSQPEGAAVAYYWNGRGFTEVWTAD
jgi:hypothetical protein